MSPNEYIKALRTYADYVEKWMYEHSATEEDWKNPDFEEVGIVGSSECYVCFVEWLNNEYLEIQNENEEE